MIVILHGWSDESRSFQTLTKRLRALNLPGPIRPIYLGDYVTMDDDVTFDDIIRAMDRAWNEARLPRTPRSVDMIVHSTGALVARSWMTRFFKPETNPLHRLLMLAPANFGSPLAHKGISFLGRIAKGYKSKRVFHTGKQILRGLELASPFTRRLAMIDRFDPANRWYGPGRVLATVLVGTRGYSGIAAAANTPGSDGTVLVSSANLNPGLLALDFATDARKPVPMHLAANGETAFCRVPGDNHSTIACKDSGPKHPDALEMMRSALTVEDNGFVAYGATLAQRNAEYRRDEAKASYTQGYQNTVLWVRDDQHSNVGDYFFEAFAKRLNSDSEDKALTEIIQREVLTSVHTNQINPACRSLKFNCDALHSLLLDQLRPLHLSITASPEIRDTGSVGYSTIAYDDIGSVKIAPNELGTIFVPDRTLFVDLTIRRQQVADLVRFRAAE
ncbi:MAG: hypothetical protein A3E01_18695 [Gammaproteobacteria bacterium RIFCSPHIGHO2_12_FULL_63_22]|nr:MAG: hypothetical protein A3E01_18695 [Gammaproteobacteria bacterium RIFCSPHIGHO2_12_FULL_63_22]